MAMIYDAFAGRCLELVSKLIEEEVVMMLGVKDDLRRLQEKLEMIKDLLFDAERRRIEDAAINRWLSQLRDVMYDADNIIDDCKIKGRQLLQEGEPRPSTSSSPGCSSRFPLLSCFAIKTTVTSIPLRHEIGKQIQKLSERLEDIYKNRQMFSLPPQSGSSNAVANQVKPPQTCPLAKSNVVGGSTKYYAKMLAASLVKSEDKSLLVFAITGLGGIGKTTLAQKIYNHQRVENNFQKRIWVCVSQNFLETELLKQIIRSAHGDYGSAEAIAELQPILISILAGSRFLLVLDDLWRAHLWTGLLQTPLEQAAGTSGSRVLITTRNLDVAKTMQATQIHQVEKLSPNDGWELLSKSVFKDVVNEDVENLHDIGMQIVKKCDGLPLAIEAVAGVLRRKVPSKSEWENVYKRHAWEVAGKLPEAVRGALYFSYEDLPSHLKQCFLLCSLFPEDATLSREVLLQYWVAEGFIQAQGDYILEDAAVDCYNDLISRCLLRLNPNDHIISTCRVHDLTRSLAQVLTEEENKFVDGNESSVSKSMKQIRRLVINNGKESTAVLNDHVKTPECLRTLGLMKCWEINLIHVFQKFTHLRILDLRESRIESIPKSIKNLCHLRYLNLDGTTIHVLPDSIGCLSNLQFLNLRHCKSLHTLPKAITQLYNLRHLGISGTPINHVPVGIGKLVHLNRLEGFEIGAFGDGRQLVWGDLNELQSLSNLRYFSMEGSQRVQSRGIQPFKDKCYLKELHICCNMDDDLQFLVPERIEHNFEELCPHTNLENLFIYFFLGRKFPEWLGCMLPNLTSLTLVGCIVCRELPPIGLLPQLRFLHIASAASVVTIGPEFLGFDRKDGHGQHGTPTAFPKLEELTMTTMLQWEEWECDAQEVEGGRGTTIKLLPRLQILTICNCPKLKALPQGLKNATALKILRIEDADSLREVKNILCLEDSLLIAKCQRLERISHLPALRAMAVRDSSRTLKFVENLDALQTMAVRLEDEWIERLPEWLLGLVQQAKVNGVLEDLSLYCRDALAKKCIMDGEYWPLLNHIPDVSLYPTEKY